MSRQRRRVEPATNGCDAEPTVRRSTDIEVTAYGGVAGVAGNHGGDRSVPPSGPPGLVGGAQVTEVATRVGALLLAAVLLVGCAALGLQGRRGPVGLSEVTVAGRASLDVGVGTCLGDPELASLEQTADLVTIEVVATRSATEGPACMDILRVDLDAPLGDREVVDAVSGRSLPVRGPF